VPPPLLRVYGDSTNIEMKMCYIAIRGRRLTSKKDDAYTTETDRGNLVIIYWQNSDFQVLFGLDIYPVGKLSLEIPYFANRIRGVGEEGFGVCFDGNDAGQVNLTDLIIPFHKVHQ